MQTNPLIEPPPIYTQYMTSSPPDKPPTGGPTKDEILAIAMQKLDLKPADIFADIGCGTGKVTCAVAPLVALVHAIDIREEAFLWTSEEIRRSTITNVSMHHDNAVSILGSLEKLDVAFVGGSRDLAEVLRHLSRLRIRTVVITAVLLETLMTAVNTLKELNMFQEVVQVQVSKSIPLAGGLMLKPLDPVFIIHGGCT